MSIFKADAIEYINSRVSQANRDTRALFEEGNEDKIMLEIEAQRKVYLFLKEKGVETARKRNLKKLKEYGDASIGAPKRLIDTRKAGEGKKPKTKDEKLSDTLKGLGLSPDEFLKRLKG